jgi:hypothetical protein
MLAVQRDKEKRRRGAHPTELSQLMLGSLLRAALEPMKSPTDSLEDPEKGGACGGSKLCLAHTFR